MLRGLLSHPLVRAYGDTLTALDGTAADFADRYGALCATRFSCGDIAQAVLDAVHFDTNTLTDTINAPEAAVLNAATHDLDVLNALLALDGEAFKSAAADKFYEPALEDLPDFEAAELFAFTVRRLPITTARRATASSHSSVFAMQDDGWQPRSYIPMPSVCTTCPATNTQKQKILKNTLAFLDGRDANNILLYGDKGTGKSSTVKAVANEYADRGLKIIEMSPRQITNFPKLFEQTLRSPFRFIVFLDDLTFSSEDGNFAALKAFIEGGLAGKPSNLVIYATSNRRHLIRESMADRQGDEVRVRDTLETVTSLSDRFGLEITFSVPDKDEYLYIVEQLAKENDLNLDIDELHLLAERFALRRNGRSPRTARQFISQQLAEQYGK